MTSTFGSGELKFKQITIRIFNLIKFSCLLISMFIKKLYTNGLNFAMFNVVFINEVHPRGQRNSNTRMHE